MILKINNSVAEPRKASSPLCVMMPGDILLVNGNSKLSALIKRAEKSDISHAALAIDTNHIIEAGSLAKVEVKPMHYGSYIVKRMELTEEQRKAVIQSAMTFKGYRFNYMGSLIWCIRLLIRNLGVGKTFRPQRVWCSELVDRAYQMAGIDLVPGRVPGDVIPPDLLNSPLLKEVCRVGLAKDIRISA